MTVTNNIKLSNNMVNYFIASPSSLKGISELLESLLQILGIIPRYGLPSKSYMSH